MRAKKTLTKTERRTYVTVAIDPEVLAVLRADAAENERHLAAQIRLVLRRAVEKGAAA